MKALILSAGKGTRIKEITKDEIPKVMLPIAGKPILEHHINLLRKYGITDMCINLHFKPEHIKKYFGDGSKFGVKITYNYEPELMGTAGALHGFKDILTETFVVFYGDIMNEVNITKFYKFHKSHESVATLVVHPSDHPEDSDTVELGENDRIKALHHKPGTREFGIITSAACYILEPVVYKYLPEGKSDFVKDVFPKMIEAGEPVYGYNTDEYLKDMGTVERYMKVKARYEKK
jgi:NDP-sugar pyrophosphorylase family protein